MGRDSFMNDLLTSVRKDFPVFLPHDVIKFYNKNLLLLNPNHMVKGITCFSNYHFGLPSGYITPVYIDNNLHRLEKNKLFPTNPGQEVNVKYEEPTDSYYSFFINAQYLEGMAESIYGIRKLLFNNQNYTLPNDLFNSFKVIIEEATHKQKGHELIIDSIISQLSINILRATENNNSTYLTNTKNDRHNLKLAIEYMEENFCQDFSLNDIAKIANFSPYHFIRVFKNQTGKTPHQYLIELKIQKAKFLLQSNKYNITEISHLCGFSNSSHFDVTFKRKTGMSPSEYRIEIRK